jgi:hypothetical protein
MKLIKVTSLSTHSPIYINIDMIGDFYEISAMDELEEMFRVDNPETKNSSSVSKPKHTRIGVVTHNNGGFNVKESIEEILKLIKDQNT